MSITDAPRCQARKRNGDPCNQAAMIGLKVCYVHGGASKKAREAGKRRRAQELAMNTVIESTETEREGKCAG